ncbi:MAG TPA: phosphatase PAP2 family protein [Micromonosporaceae bacterium]|nr:phosphatase PAP2 family protein [Micromonosporaceae bacterium]
MRNQTITERDISMIDPVAPGAGTGVRVRQRPVPAPHDALSFDDAGTWGGSRARRWLRPEEVVYLLFTLALLGLALHTGRGHASLVALLGTPTAAVAGGIGTGLVLAAAAYRTRAPARAPGHAVAVGGITAAGRARAVLADAVFTLRYVALVLAWVAFYAVLHDITPALHPQVVDGWLVAADRALFGTDVSRWLNDHLGSAVMTQVMTFCYLSYFVTPLVYSAWHYYRRNLTAYRDFALSVAFLGVLGYSGYALVPAVGPHLYQASLYPDPMPGSGPLIEVVRLIQGDARDAFPSLHTGFTIVLLYLMWRDLRRAFWVYLPVGLGLLLSTMYLRRHYAVDLLAGVAIAVVAVVAAVRLNRRWYARPAGAPG